MNPSFSEAVQPDSARRHLHDEHTLGGDFGSASTISECQRRSFNFRSSTMSFLHSGVEGGRCKLNYNHKPSSATGCDFALRLRQMEAEMRVILCSVLAAVSSSSAAIDPIPQRPATRERRGRRTREPTRSVATAGRLRGARAAEAARWQKPERGHHPRRPLLASHSIRASAPTRHVEQPSRPNLTRSIHVRGRAVLTAGSRVSGVVTEPRDRQRSKGAHT